MASITPRGSVELFVSYSHKDEAFKTELVNHLSVLRRQKLISIWFDRNIGPGEEWRGQIDCHLNTAAIILLLISADFLASDYCCDVEMRRALQRHYGGEARVIPVIIRPVDWKGTEISNLQALPTNGRPVIKWSVPDDAYLDIAKGIRDVINGLAFSPRRSVPLPSLHADSTPEQPAQVEPEVEQDKPYVYVIGRIVPRCPSLGVEKEFMHATARLKTAGLSDQQAKHSVLTDSENRYLAREMCWVLTTDDVDAYLLIPRDTNDLSLLVESVRSELRPNDLDVVIGIRGAPQMYGPAMMGTVLFDQIYSMDIDSLLGSIPLPAGMSEAGFKPVAEELLISLITGARNGCGTDADRALSYLAVRYAEPYALAAEVAVDGLRLKAVEVSLSPVSSEDRKIVNVFFSYASRKTLKSDRYVVGVDVTEKYPFLVSKLSRCR